MRQDFQCFVIYILFVIRGICISQFTVEAARKAKLVFVGENMLQSCEVVLLHPSRPLCCVSCWYFLEFSQKADISCMAERRGDFFAPQSQIRKNLLQMLCWKRVCKRMWNSNKKCCIFPHITEALHFSGSSKLNPCSCIQILQGWKEGALFPWFSHSHIFRMGGARVARAWNVTWVYFLLRISAIVWLMKCRAWFIKVMGWRRRRVSLINLKLWT